MPHTGNVLVGIIRKGFTIELAIVVVDHFIPCRKDGECDEIILSARIVDEIAVVMCFQATGAIVICFDELLPRIFAAFF